MLYGKSRKVLRAIQFLSKDTDPATSLDVIVYLHNRILSEDFDGCKKKKKKEGLIKTTSNDLGVAQYELTHLGKHYSEFQRAEFVRFLLRSILVPIVVAVITTLITNGVAK